MHVMVIKRRASDLPGASGAELGAYRMGAMRK
jgi:hypothetical protein